MTKYFGKEIIVLFKKPPLHACCVKQLPPTTLTHVAICSFFMLFYSLTLSTILFCFSGTTLMKPSNS